MAVRFLIVDDSEIFRDGLRQLLEAQPEWEVCGEAGDGVEAVEKARALTPDLIVMDFVMPRLLGIDAAREIQREFPGTPIVLLALDLTQQLVENAGRAGIRVAVSKLTMNGLPERIHELLQDENFEHPPIDS